MCWKNVTKIKAKITLHKADKHRHKLEFVSFKSKHGNKTFVNAEGRRGWREGKGMGGKINKIYHV